MNRNTLDIVMAQLNPTVGDLAGNVAKIIACTRRAQDEMAADLVVFPELVVTGYFPEDLLFHNGFKAQLATAVEILQRELPRNISVLLGMPQYEDGKCFNCAVLFRNGEFLASYRKHLLPNYGVFDEKRYFTPGDSFTLVELNGVKLGLTVCEDLWQPGIAAAYRDRGAELLLNVSASPFEIGRQMHREQRVLSERVREAGLPIIYVNQVGGQDELVFDGGSLAVSRAGRAAMRAPSFVEGLYQVRAIRHADCIDLAPGNVHIDKSTEESVYRALVLGIRDYVDKNGFPGVVIGLSGGIDSALTLALAVDALGADKVVAIMMPTEFTAGISISEAERQAELLGVEYHSIPIEAINAEYLQALRDIFGDAPRDTTEENLQARIRGVLLMAVSNKSGRMVLTTSNKSETAVGYATLYGDMVGGYAPLKDVFKTMVYRLANYRNHLSPAIPEAVIAREPSAELAHNQKDSDSLPPYDVLDGILAAHLEEDLGFTEIVERGYDAATVGRVLELVKRNEYKRRQAAPGARISGRAFGRERRYPITSGFRHR